MERKTTNRHTRSQRVRRPPAIDGIAVEFPFDDLASPSAKEIALVFGILPDILDDLLAAPDAPKED